MPFPRTRSRTCAVGPRRPLKHKRMRGQLERTGSLSFCVSPEDPIPWAQPLRQVMGLADQGWVRLYRTL